MNRERLSDLVTLIQGDCLDVLPSASEFAAVISDPPYGMDWDTDITRFSGGHNRDKRRAGRNDLKAVAGDRSEFDPSPWIDFPKVVLFGANHFAHRLPAGSLFVWVKKNDGAFGSFLSDAEVAWVKGGRGVYCHRDTSINAEALHRLHPTQKPVGLMRWCIRRLKLPAGAHIIDPYAGSGTTGIAAALEGYPCTLVEIDGGHCETIRQRVRAEVKKWGNTLFPVEV